MTRFLLFVSLLALSATSLAAPRVVVSIAPVHAIVSGVMEGVGEPALLLRPGASPHGYTLRPSDARLLDDADLVMWVGPELETFLVKPIEVLAERASRVTLMEAPGMTLLPYRGHDHADHAHAGADPHIWLSVANAARIAAIAAESLASLDPANASRYLANAGILEARYQALGEELRERLRPVRSVPYLVFHDAYRYFEQESELNNVGSIVLAPQLGPGVERMAELRRIVSEAGVRCVFSEPQFPESLAGAVAEGSGARVSRLDPLGVDVEPGVGGYARLMRAFAEAMARCLDGSQEEKP